MTDTTITEETTAILDEGDTEPTPDPPTYDELAERLALAELGINQLHQLMIMGLAAVDNLGIWPASVALREYWTAQGIPCPQLPPEIEKQVADAVKQSKSGGRYTAPKRTPSGLVVPR